MLEVNPFSAALFSFGNTSKNLNYMFTFFKEGIQVVKFCLPFE